MWQGVWDIFHEFLGRNFVSSPVIFIH